jgi:hypothetical protein
MSDFLCEAGERCSVGSDCLGRQYRAAGVGVTGSLMGRHCAKLLRLEGFSILEGFLRHLTSLLTGAFLRLTLL